MAGRCRGLYAADLRAGRAPAARARRPRRAPPRRPPAAPGSRSRSSWATIGASASTIEAEPLEPDDPARAGGRRARARRRAPRTWRSPATGAARPRGRAPGRRPGSARRAGPSAGAAASSRDRRRRRRRPASGRRRRRARRPSAPVRTSQAVAIARSSGSRSSSVVVVTNACGSAAIRRTRCDRRSGSSSQKTSSRRRSGGRPSSAVSRSSSASLRARIAVRCWPREAKLARSRPASSKTRSSRCGPIERRPVPDLLVGRLDEPPGERVPRRLAGERRRVRHVAQRQPRRRPPRPARSPRGRPPAARRAPRAGAAARSTIAAAGVEEGAVPEAQLVARGALLADRPQQAVALLERPAVRRQGVGVGRRAGRGQLVDDRPAQRRRADDQEHLLGREEDDPQQPAEARRPPAEAVDPDPLAARRTRRAGAHDRDLERVRSDAPLDAGEVRAPADQLAVGAGPVRAAPGQQDDRLEQARLAGRVRAPDQVRPGPERHLERWRSPGGRAG